jgi:glutathione synthase/RimK-type ligase-like ATP-grasp enzyme
VILLWGLLEDPCVRSVHDCLLRLHASVSLVNHAEIGRTRVRYSSEPSAKFRLSCGDVSLDLHDVSSAYLRPYDYRDYVGYRPASDGEVGQEGLVHHLVAAWAEQSNGRIINRPSAEASNHSKLFQAMHLLESGFSVPASLVSNDPAAVRRFLAEHRELIYKSMSGVRSVVRSLDPRDLDAIGAMGPVFFQQRVCGPNVRVHVVGTEVTACAIESDAIDYRYSSATRFSPTKLPADVADRCVRVTQHLGLVLSGLDLIHGSDDCWYCLEVNPNPAFSVFEDGVRDRVAGQMAAYLMGTE